MKTIRKHEIQVAIWEHGVFHCKNQCSNLINIHITLTLNSVT